MLDMSNWSKTVESSELALIRNPTHVSVFSAKDMSVFGSKTVEFSELALTQKYRLSVFRVEC